MPTRRSSVEAGRREREFAFAFAAPALSPYRSLSPWPWLWLGLCLSLWVSVSLAPDLAAAEAKDAVVAEPLTTIGAVLGLTERQARLSLPVRIAGVVTYYEPRWDTLFLQDDTGGIYVFPGPQPRPALRPGQRIELQGRTVASRPSHAVAEESLVVTGTSPLPAPDRIDGRQLAGGAFDARWVELDAVIRGWVIRSQRLEVDLDLGESRVTAHSPRPKDSPPPAEFVHARARIRGVASVVRDNEGRITSARLYVPDFDSYRILTPPAADPFSLPSADVTRFRVETKTPADDPRWKVRGVVVLVRDGEVIVEVGDVGLSVRPHRSPDILEPDSQTDRRPEPPRLIPGDEVEAVGYLAGGPHLKVMEDAVLRRIGTGHALRPLRIRIGDLDGEAIWNRLVELEAELVQEPPIETGPIPMRRWMVRWGNERLELTLPLRLANPMEIRPGSRLRVRGVAEPRMISIESTTRCRILLRSAEDLTVLSPPLFRLTREAARVLGLSLTVTLALLGWVLLLWRERGRQRALNRELEHRIQQRTTELTETNRHLQEKVAEQRQVEAALLESEVRNRTILEHSPQGLVVLDPAAGGRLLEVNEAAARLFEADRSSLVFKTPAELSPPRQPDGLDSAEAADRHIERALASGAHRFEWMHRNARGKELLCEVQLAPIRMGGRQLVIASVTDITARRRAERIRKAIYEISEAAHNAEDLPALYGRIHAVIRQLMNADNLYIAHFDPERNLLSFPYYVDEKDPTPPTRAFGQGLTEYVLRTGKPLLADARVGADLSRDGEYVPIGSPAALWLGVPLSLRGRPFGVLAIQEYHNPQAFGTDAKEVLGFVAEQIAIAIDRRRAIDERLAGEARLRESEERFSKAFHNSPGSLSIVSLDDGRFLDVNDGFVRTYGYRRSEALGKTSLELGLWHDLAHRERLYARLREDGWFRNEETVLVRRDGQLITVVQSADTIDIGGRRCVIVFALDITDRKRAETELFHALRKERELSQLKSNFVSLVSHEFRTPLEVILSSAEILDRYHTRLAPEQRTRQLRGITTSVRRMAHMMNEVLLLGRFDAGRMAFQPAPLDLAAFCQRIVDEIAAATDQRCPIGLRLEGDFAGASGDEGLLGHIFTNLLSNAVKYSPPGSPVQFEVRRHGPEAVFTVADRGLGIPEADRGRLFLAFYRGSNVGQAPGSGLGLVIVRRCADLHRGTLHFTSHEGVGTTFEARIPLWNGTTEHDLPVPAPKTIPA